MKRLLFLLVLAATASAAPRPYHLQLEANPAAPFPFLSRFGTVALDVYPAGVRAETVWLNGFSRDGAPAVTVDNPLGRMYTDVPLSEIAPTLTNMSSSRGARPVYGPAAWIDVWDTEAIPPNAQLRAIVEQFVAGIAPPTAAALRAIP